VCVDLRDVGLEQIRAGMAWHYKEYQHEQTTQDRLVYRDEEEGAKARFEAGAAVGVAR
jgi:endonuclease YncB( thermonuclease family)